MVKKRDFQYHDDAEEWNSLGAFIIIIILIILFIITLPFWLIGLIIKKIRGK